MNFDFENMIEEDTSQTSLGSLGEWYIEIESPNIAIKSPFGVRILDKYNWSDRNQS